MAERERKLLQAIELLSEYGRAKLGGDWWPGNAAGVIGERHGQELSELLDFADGLAAAVARQKS